MSPSFLATLARTEVRLRMRRLSTVVVLLGVVALSWLMLGDPAEGATLISVGEARVLYTSSALSLGGASLGGLLFSLAGFFLVRGRIAEDLRTNREAAGTLARLAPAALVDLRPFTPNSLLFAHRLKVPYRVGFPLRGLSYTLHAALRFDDVDDVHVRVPARAELTEGVADGLPPVLGQQHELALEHRRCDLGRGPRAIPVLGEDRLGEGEDRALVGGGRFAHVHAASLAPVSR